MHRFKCVDEPVDNRMRSACALLIDDHAIFRFGLRNVIETAVPWICVFEAGSIDEALACPAAVDIVLLDNKLMGLSGIAGIALIKQKWPAVQILMLSSQYDSDTVRLALERGATGFLSKGESAATIVSTLHQVIANSDESNVATMPTVKKSLTPRQFSVLALLNQGMSSKQIASELFISENTARRHVQDIIDFFGVASRAEAVFCARNQGLLS